MTIGDCLSDPASQASVAKEVVADNWLAGKN